MTVEEIERRFLRAAAAAINLAADDLLARSERRVPLLEGHLRATGRVSDRAQPHWGYPSAEVSYAGPYAAAQHEGRAIQHRGGLGRTPKTLIAVTTHRGRALTGGTRLVLWEAHRYTTPGTGPKFLEGPLKEMVPEYERFLARTMRPFFEARAA